MASDRPQDRDRAVTIPARAGRAGRVPPLVARMTIRRPLRRWGGYALAVGGTVILTAVLLPFRSSLAELTEAFGYLGVVVAAAAVGGVGPGMASSVLAFLVFNFFFLPPYDSFAIGRAEDIVVLFVFLAFSVLISATLARARERASAAEAREAELAGLQELSAQLVATGPAAGGYAPVLARVAALFGFTSATLATGPTPAGGVALRVAGQQLGQLLFDGNRPPLTDSERRVLRAFADQFALAVERDRLAQAALESEVYRETDQVRRSLLAAVSHDLRSPLAAIKASVTDLLDADADHAPDDVRDALESVNSETDRLASMIANLLDMSRIEGGTLHARIQDVDLEEVLGECTERVHRRWPALDLSVGVDEDAAVVRADPVFLDRVVANLLENAAKAARGHDPGVAAGARRDDGRVIVSVTDHGEGVPEALRGQLFYPFYRGTERLPGTGTGLGLAICKGFLALMAGEIWVDETPGGGATFRFSLPAAPQLPPVEAGEPSEAGEQSEAGEPSQAGEPVEAPPSEAAEP